MLIMGLPGAGKSTLAESLAAEVTSALNRDERGGSLRALLPSIASGSSRTVLDNTYVSRKVAGGGDSDGAAARLPCAASGSRPASRMRSSTRPSRIVSRHGRLLAPEEIRSARRKQDVAVFGPTVQFRYQRELEPPDPSEGFSRIDDGDLRTQARRVAASTGRSIVWCDGVLRRGRSGRRAPSSQTTSRCLRSAGKSCVAMRLTAGGCWDSPGSRKSPTTMLTRPRSRMASRGCGSFWDSRSRSNTARMPPGRRSAGAGSRSPASAWCS